MAADQIELRVALADGALGADELAEQLARLREELAQLDVDELHEASGGEAPPGTKGVELAVLGALVVKLARSKDVLGQVVDTIRDWLTRNHSQSVRVEIGGDVIELTGASPEERQQLIDAWLARHAER